MADFQPPPTHTLPVLVDERTGKSQFNPIWLKWFLDLSASLGPSGAGSVTSVAQSFTGGLISVSGSPVTTSGTLALTVTGTSGGIPYFSSASAWASSGALTANRIVLGGGAGAAPTILGSLGTTTTVLHGNAGGAPSFSAVVLTTDVSGILPVANGGTGVDNTTQVYTPTRSAETNLDANVTPSQAQYASVGSVVTVSGRFTADPTLTATATSFEFSLPIASNIGAVEDCSGVAFCGAIVGQGAEITGSVANNTAVFSWISGDVTSQTWSYTYTYRVI